MYSRQTIERILTQVAKRKISSAAAFKKLKYLSSELFRFAELDHHRLLRKNLPEVVYAPGKSPIQLTKIARAILKSGGLLLITRLEKNGFEKLRREIPQLRYSEDGRLAYVKARHGGRTSGLVSVVTAGTSDIPVAEEAAVTLELMGKKVKRFYDCGVAGLHRLLNHLEDIERADVIICVAGMEGALASVLAGLVSKPVIAVPTSVGYGSSFKGLAPLLTMLNSCAQGVAVVNIDSGFNAACFTNLVLDKNSE